MAESGGWLIYKRCGVRNDKLTIMATTTSKDHWSTESYKNAADFVPKLTTTVIKYLDPQPGDKILDIGCGDGILTTQIAHAVGPAGTVLGLDASESFIKTATSTQLANCSYTLQDCTKLGGCSAVDGSWSKVFSNAALHWILRREETRQTVFENVYQALKPGGVFVLEMGGKGNVAEIHAAFISALVMHGVPLQQAREVCPWFFPSVEWLSSALQRAGFVVEKCELEYRPTKTADGGIESWVRLMGAQFLDAVDEAQRDAVVYQVCEILETIITKEEDGSKWIGYVRLRAVAKKT